MLKSIRTELGWFWNDCRTIRRTELLELAITKPGAYGIPICSRAIIKANLPGKKAPNPSVTIMIELGPTWEMILLMEQNSEKYSSW